MSDKASGLAAERFGHQSEPAIVVRGLRVEIATQPTAVVDDVSFSISSGTILGVVGESGSGKTTVAHALLGHARRGLRIAAGSVLVAGHDITTLRADAIRAVRGSVVSYVPQDPAAALNPAMRIGKQIEEMLTVHAGSRFRSKAITDERIAELLAEVRLDGVTDILKAYPHQLSGGQQQRVAIAMAFACRPALIVLDEPTTGLDVTTQRHVLETVSTLCRDHGTAAVYVSHDLAVVAQLADEVAVMYAGRFVERGSVAQVLSRPKHPYARALLAAVPSLRMVRRIRGIDGHPPRPGSDAVGCAFAPRCHFAKPCCMTEPIPMQSSESGHEVRCIRASELKFPPTSSEEQSGSSCRPERTEILGVSGLLARYGRRQVLHEVSLRVEKGSCTAIVGESGSGKTTLASCIVGLHEDWTGSVSLAGVELRKSARQRARRTLQDIQYVFQNPYNSLNPRKTIGTILNQRLRQFSDLDSRRRRERVLQVLDEVSLAAPFVNRFPGELSGGERQRVAIARALLVDPVLLVCDEVTSALDVSVQAVIVKLLAELQERRELSLLFVTHSLALVRTIAQDVVVLSGGRVADIGSVEQVLVRPRDPYTVQLVADVPELPDDNDATVV